MYIVAHDALAACACKPFVLRMTVPAQLCVVTRSFIFPYYGLSLYIVSASICVHVLARARVCVVCVCVCVCVCVRAC